MPASETDMLAELIGNKHTCLVQLRDMGQRQIELIESGDMTALLDLLAAKQRVLIRLQQVERAMDPFREQDPEQRAWRTPQDRQQSAARLQECESLLSQIVEQEKQGESALIRRRDDAAVKLQGAHHAGQARGAYTSETRTKTNQLDLLSDT